MLGRVKYLHMFNNCTELAKKVCPWLRDLATVPAGGITQPRTHFFGQLCTSRFDIGVGTFLDNLEVLDAPN